MLVSEAEYPSNRSKWHKQRIWTNVDNIDSLNGLSAHGSTLFLNFNASILLVLSLSLWLKKLFAQVIVLSGIDIHTWLTNSTYSTITRKLTITAT